MATEKTVTLVINIETVDGTKYWWATSPDVPGFSALGADLEDLLTRSRVALYEAVGTDITVRPRLAARPPDTSNPTRTRGRGDDRDEDQSSGWRAFTATA